MGSNLAGIVCLKEEASSEALAQILGILWLHNPIVTGIPPSNTELQRIAGFVRDCEKIGSKRPILFHSESGLNRPGTILAALLIILDDISPDSAIDQIQAINPLALSNHADYLFVSNLKPFTLDH
jgi:protein-tyrosine phosphatase